MGLPAGGFHDRLQRCPLGPSQQSDHTSCLAVAATLFWRGWRCLPANAWPFNHHAPRLCLAAGRNSNERGIRSSDPESEGATKAQRVSLGGSGANLALIRLGPFSVSIESRLTLGSQGGLPNLRRGRRASGELADLNCPFLIFSASSIPLITTAAFWKLFNPASGQAVASRARHPVR